MVKKSFCRIEILNIVAGAREQVGNGPPHRLLIIDHEDRLFHKYPLGFVIGKETEIRSRRIHRSPRVV
jgi:hypothetical protein